MFWKYLSTWTIGPDCWFANLAPADYQNRNLTSQYLDLAVIVLSITQFLHEDIESRPKQGFLTRVYDFV
jgi:hypothetical protein